MVSEGINKGDGTPFIQTEVLTISPKKLVPAISGAYKNVPAVSQSNIRSAATDASTTIRGPNQEQKYSMDTKEKRGMMIREQTTLS